MILHDAAKGDHGRAEMLIGVSEAATDPSKEEAFAQVEPNCALLNLPALSFYATQPRESNQELTG